ncbi:hypothetical protein [Methanolacinia paynteri]|uniref:hypothetical protein n=1 Tax=Methanolacinia paynteri TaxID=230356 RepID=UPI00064E275A|nr:hypothetical protein [Methanolacinia paynteri]
MKTKITKKSVQKKYGLNKSFKFCLVLILLICFSAGCISQTSNETAISNYTEKIGSVGSDNNIENNQTGTATPEKSTGESKSLRELFNGYSNYIQELFPYFIPETINNKIPWEESDPVIPAIKVYTYKDLKTSDGIIYEARINAETGKIRSVYESSGYLAPSGEVKLTLDEGEEIARSFVLKAFGQDPDDIGDPDNIFTTIKTSNYVNLDRFNKLGKAANIYVRYYNKYEGLDGGPVLQMTINSISGNVTSCQFNIPNLQNHTFSSSVPSVSLDEAKEIIEEKIDEKYPGEVKTYEFLNDDKSEMLLWDTGVPVYYDNTTPVRLIWELEFNVERNIGAEPDISKFDDSTYGAVIDAHSGEILCLFYKDITIDYLKKYY